MPTTQFMNYALRHAIVTICTSYSSNQPFNISWRVKTCHDSRRKVRQDDIGNQAKNRIWLEKPVSQALIFKDLDATWQQLVPTMNVILELWYMVNCLNRKKYCTF